jgi:soluble lytic murein transglycosylase-like protein
METVRFESQPPGAEAKTSTGQSCRTPCALALPTEKPFTVTYTLTGFQPQTENIELVSQGDGTSSLRPNPVLVQLTAAQQKKKPPAKRRVTAKPKPKAQAQQPPEAAPPPMQPAAQPRTNSPWPSNPPATGR